MFKIFGKLFPILLIVFPQNALSDDAKPIRIAALLALSGDIAPLGNEVLRGAQIAVEEHKSLPVTLIVEDIQSLVPKVAVSAAHKVLDTNKVDAAVTMIVEEAQPIAPLFDRAQRPLLVLWDSNKSLSEMGRFVFSNGFSTEKAGQKWLNLLTKNSSFVKLPW